MPRPVSEKCRRCAKQPVAVAKEKECWEGQKCHVRRSNYKKRDSRNRQRRKQYRVNQGAVPAEAEVMSAAGEMTTTKVIEVPVPQSVGAIVHFWRQNQSAPLHAIGFDLYKNGNKTVQVEPVHTIGWTTKDVKSYMGDVLRSLSQHLKSLDINEEINKFEAQVEHAPETCQIEDCPLSK